MCEKQVSIIRELSRWKRSGAGSTDVSPDTRHGEWPLWSLPSCQPVLHGDHVLPSPMRHADSPGTQMQSQTRRKKRSRAMSLSGAGVQTRPRGRITIMTSWVGKVQVYYSILGPQLASAPARLAGFFSCIGGYVCWMWEEKGEKHVNKGRKHMQKQWVQGKQVVPSWFAWLTTAALSPQTCRDDLQINREIGSAVGEPPFYLWLSTRPVLPRSCLSRYDYKNVCFRAAAISGWIKSKPRTREVISIDWKENISHSVVVIHNVVNVSIYSHWLSPKETHFSPQSYLLHFSFVKSEHGLRVAPI